VAILREGRAPRKGRLAKCDPRAPFPLAVPDYVQADWLLAKPRPRPRDGEKTKRGRRRSGGGLHWAVHQAVLVQKTSRVILADVVLAQVLWGGDRGAWPRNWRQRIVQKLKRAAASNTGLSEVVHRETDLGERACPPGCVLRGTGARHQHLEVTIRTPEESGSDPEGNEEAAAPEFDGCFLGALEVFGYGDDPDRAYHWSPRPLPPEPEGEVCPDEKQEREEHQRLLRDVKRLRREGRLAAVYLPLKLFGPSPRVGLPWQQRQLLLALTRELTRGRGETRSGRPDRAEIIPGGQGTGGVAACPYLGAGVRHVGFNGNGGGRKKHLRGRGYKVAVWMRKAAYGGDEESRSLWRRVRRFLRDLADVAGPFGLAAGAWHPKECSWRSLAELLPMTGHSPGRAWLRGCLLRVYTPEDFLARWRVLFADRMGFSVIPDVAQEVAVEPGNPTASREAFLTYLSEKGVSLAELARGLGVSRSLVSHNLSGRRGWTPSWQERLENWIAGA
jgi:hypothetical protein